MKYLDIILTAHAEDQLKKRGITPSDAWETIKHPTRTLKGKNGGTEFEREFEGFKVTVAAVLNEKREWVVKSLWRNPPLPGTDDERRAKDWKKYKKAGFFGKILIQIRQQLGF